MSRTIPLMRMMLAPLIAATLLAFAGAPASADTITLTDIAGRKVTIERPVKRIVLGEGRQLLSIALIHPDPVSVLAGWPGDLKRQDPVTYNRWRERFPAIDDVPVVGQGNLATFSMEQALTAKPDLAILSGGYGPSAQSTEVIENFERAGVPVVFIDFVAEPLTNTIPSMTVLGKALGREKEAQAYIEFYRSRYDRIRNRLAKKKPKLPTVLMHAHAGLGQCCNSPGGATIGAFIDAAGGHNIATDVLKKPFGQLSLEYVIARNPEVYVGTGGIHLEGRGGLVLGPGVETSRAQSILAKLTKQPGLAELSAVRHGRVHGLWHLFNNVPLNILAVEALARWFHPDLFPDIDPAASLREINEKFLPVPMTGTYWVRLDPKQP